ncbi:MAG: ABC transporter permease [Planctomycetota bacterium]
MNLFAISLRNLRVRLVSTALTALSVSLGAALVAALWSLADQADERYARSIRGYKAIVGPAEGSKLDLTLNVVLNLGDSPGVVPLRVLSELERLERSNSRFKHYAFPQVRGDSVQGFPVIGTTDLWFTKFSLEKLDTDTGTRPPLEFASGGPWSFGNDQLFPFAESMAEVYNHELLHDAAGEEGHSHNHDHEHQSYGDLVPIDWRKAVLGAEAAAVMGIGVGESITPVHGTEDSDLAHEHPEAQCEVIGVLKKTGSAIDRSIYVPAPVMLALSGHRDGSFDQEKLEPAAEDLLLSAIVLRTFDHRGADFFQRHFRSSKDAQVAWPQGEIVKLLEAIGDAKEVLHVIAWLVVLVSSLGVLVALYNTMNERRREIAIMRSLGARRSQIFSIIVVEAVALSLVGATLGVLLCHLGLSVAGGWIEDRAGIPVDGSAFLREELYLVLGLGLLGGLAGVLPAVKASRTEVQEHLTPTT